MELSAVESKLLLKHVALVTLKRGVLGEQQKINYKERADSKYSTRALISSRDSVRLAPSTLYMYMFYSSCGTQALR